ncbi:FecR family protein [Allomuricauda sp. SCSIO 65647]|uniref:FecR family protein n=1 Tax=Allomuricauda sp. SCSIO 65647 TaxID=2908843 RepID=UPI001F21CD5C|nr:FecR domain-containing protein [Muricauda sp. SCSIO 65647]UJH66957.1 DUF4974 domain-containing protein [Muricauda sp. SCSIO 65647]
MQEKEFRRLMEKSINGSLTKEEEELLQKFQEELGKTSEPPIYNEQGKAQMRESMWKVIENRTGPKPKKKINWRAVSVAAIFIGAVGLMSLFYLTTDQKTNEIPQNAITLELEDGTIKIIEEGETADILNSKGGKLGRQDKNVLIYDKSSIKTELVYNTLTVPYGKRFEILLSDGTKVHLNSGSSIKYPTQFLEGMERQTFITGEAFLEVAKDSLHPFVVNANELNIKVLGTQFNVHAYPEDTVSEVVLVEGSVGLYAANANDVGTEGITLVPGDMGSFSKEDHEISTSKVITDIYTSWMEGELVFRDMPFGNMVKKLERHYDVTIINENKKISDERFSASFNKVSIERVFKNLSIYHGIEYEINDRTITIK